MNRLVNASEYSAKHHRRRCQHLNSGYGELSYSHFDYGTKSGQLLRRILGHDRFRAFGTRGTPSAARCRTAGTGGTGGALEIEYEEFGEYETEVEKGGEVILEELYIKRV